MLDEFERSGVPGTKFAAMAGVKYQTLASWIPKRRRTWMVDAPKAATLSWVEAAVQCAPTSSPLVVQMPCGITLMVCDAAQAALAGQLLRAYSSSTAAC